MLSLTKTTQAASFGAALRPVIPRSGLVAAWDFTQKTTAEQLLPGVLGTSSTAQRGSTAGADTNDPALSAQGLVFDGVDDYAQLADPSRFAFGTGSFTAIVVFRRTETANMVAVLDNKNGASNAAGLYMRSTTTGTTWARVADGAAQVAATSFQVDGWAMAGARMDRQANTLQSIHNGLVVGAPASVAALGSLTSAATLRAGSTIGGAEWMNGTIAAVLIYNRALTDAEIKATHKALKARLAPYGVTLP